MRCNAGAASELHLQVFIHYLFTWTSLPFLTHLPRVHAVELVHCLQPNPPAVLPPSGQNQAVDSVVSIPLSQSHAVFFRKCCHVRLRCRHLPGVSSASPNSYSWTLVRHLYSWRYDVRASSMPHLLGMLVLCISSRYSPDFLSTPEVIHPTRLCLPSMPFGSAHMS